MSLESGTLGSRLSACLETPGSQRKKVFLFIGASLLLSFGLIGGFEIPGGESNICIVGWESQGWSLLHDGICKGVKHIAGDNFDLLNAISDWLVMMTEAPSPSIGEFISGWRVHAAASTLWL